ncbi:MAG: acyltransferase [Acidobacteriota bacterium]
MSAGKAALVALLKPAASLWRRAGRLRRAWYHALANAELRQRVPSSSVLLGRLDLHGTGNVELGEELYLYSGLHLETQGHGAIAIGDRVVMSRGVHIVAFDSVSVGAGAMIGEYSSLRDANHRIGHTVGLRDSGHDATPIVIGENVWIGRGVTVLGGVTIGDHAVIGANSVVTRDVPSGCIAVGAPAKPLVGRSTLPGVA